MAKTKNQLVERALLRIGVLDAGESPSAEDNVYVGGEYDALRAKWQDRGLCYWPNTNATTSEIPDVVFDAVANILAGAIAPAFGEAEPVIPDENGSPMPISAIGYRDLKRHIYKRSSGEPTRAVFY